ncbi:unnamed protein product, partial [Mesorhabditis belari]|uniref:GDNF/GAS1 domain-containing protein n=1 Tax=Mesorhabditis belari TaxID=2138241 RepID=A0AAF3EZC3_9BILA
MLWREIFPLIAAFFAVTFAQEDHSEECRAAMQSCEDDLDCNNLLGPLAAACSTLTCQPQCRSAVMNLYQNKLGRVLLKTDGSCVHGRDELRQCNFMPNGDVVHCGIAKLACEGDLQCQSKLQVYMSECEAETAKGECSTKCHGFLKQLTTVPYGKLFEKCTCTEREDQLCRKMRDEILQPCVNPKPTADPTSPSGHSTPRPPTRSRPSSSDIDPSSSNIVFPSLILCALLATRVLYLLQEF